MSIRKVKDASELTDLLSRSSDIFLHFNTKKRGRPPRLQREHIKALLSLCKTLLDDIDDCLDHSMPEIRQVQDLINAFEYLNSIKRRYLNKIKYFEQYGMIPPPEEVEDDNN